MNYRPLGRTGVKVTPFCLGCWMFGWRTEADEAHKIVHRALDAGINFIDTANVYARGESERILGNALKDAGGRDRLIIATKVHGRMDDDDPNMLGNSARHIIHQCEASLKRLQLDHIDLYQIHRPSSTIPIDETLRALDSLVQSGKVRYIGTSTYGAWQIMEALWASKEHGLSRFVTEQPPYNMLDRRVERELLPMARTYGVGIIPWSPLAGGWLTGKYKRGEEITEGRWKPGVNPVDRRPNERAYDISELVVKIAGEKGCTPSQFALAWVRDQPGVTSPIIGPRTMEQCEDNLGAFDVEVTDEDRQRIDEVAPPGEMTIEYYRADFGPHDHRW